MSGMEMEALHSNEEEGQLTLEGVRSYMVSHYDRPLTIDQLSRLAGLSPNYFGEAFRKAFGQNVMEYLTAIRMGHAKQLIRDTNLYVREVASRVGYSDEYYFSRKFKKEVGVSPSVYSKQAWRRVAVWTTSSLGNLLALGKLPVAAPIDPKWTPYYYGLYREDIQVHLDCAENVKEADNLALIQHAKADVLITDKALSSQGSELVAASGVKLLNVSRTDWRSQLREMARVLGRRQEGERWIADYESRLAEVKETITAEAGSERFVTLRLFDEQLFLYSNPGIRDVLYTDLALGGVPEQREVVNMPMTIEQLCELNPERLMLIICPNAETRMYWLKLQHESRWRSLKAVQNGQVYILPSNPWFEYSAIAVRRMLEEAHVMLTGNNPSPLPVLVHGAAKLVTL
ncbi:ABC-type Fe3+-hydroxamate transport system substrate-binding protein [Paenibacillus cellulosilyticus]|uniref:ABC-type Fe3+-hydroxamate transport system substrate-binding protein n=1 Tax=Paenibacillus cellulosilyticus TaxID=375489 RepID=A0A2V2YS77_9BACL|nr:helix-turn-helix domain-containing protein [Paenibacillus cellulosilyticus]PWV99515.1 ABC-type Fe3+-hydroxamate transport system substrate-binding protein [Paenibacillus cellulosilyticus]QKS44768.1 helix-turn-helix domain-containing protein [Paenibacillus cellulosilyticus]